MKITEFSVVGPLLIEPKVHADARGFFTERWRADLFAGAGIQTTFIQDNFSRSNPKVLRGLHYQYDRPQAKLVTVLRGKILDVMVDVRSHSPTYGQVITVELSGDRPQWVWVPVGFAHGFCVLGDEPTDVLYKVDQLYNAKGENGIRWDDPDLKIAWPLRNPELSPKDLVLPTFKDYQRSPKF